MRTHIVKHKQSLLDIALEAYGTVEGIYAILDANKLNGPTDNVYVGMSIVLPKTAAERPRIVNYLSPYSIATIEQKVRALGVGWFQIESPYNNAFCITSNP